MRLTALAHNLVRARLTAGDIAIDATMGNGYDTLLLADCVGPSGRVFAFDVQAQALAKTAVRLGERPWVRLIHAGHETMRAHVSPEALGRVGAVMFNLGYLPGADKARITHTDTTLQALDQALELLRPGGILSCLVYRAHPGGAEEASAVLARAAQIGGGARVTQHQQPDADPTTPTLLVIERTAHELSARDPA